MLQIEELTADCMAAVDGAEQLQQQADLDQAEAAQLSAALEQQQAAASEQQAQSEAAVQRLASQLAAGQRDAALLKQTVSDLQQQLQAAEQQQQELADRLCSAEDQVAAEQGHAAEQLSQAAADREHLEATVSQLQLDVQQQRAASAAALTEAGALKAALSKQGEVALAADERAAALQVQPQAACFCVLTVGCTAPKVCVCTALMRQKCLHYRVCGLASGQLTLKRLCMLQVRASNAEAKVQLATEGEAAAVERERQLEQQLAEVQSSLEFSQVKHAMLRVASLCCR